MKLSVKEAATHLGRSERAVRAALKARPRRAVPVGHRPSVRRGPSLAAEAG